MFACVANNRVRYYFEIRPRVRLRSIAVRLVGNGAAVRSAPGIEATRPSDFKFRRKNAKRTVRGRYENAFSKKTDPVTFRYSYRSLRKNGAGVPETCFFFLADRRSFLSKFTYTNSVLDLGGLNGEKRLVSRAIREFQ